jgi:hypothetical protein
VTGKKKCPSLERKRKGAWTLTGQNLKVAWSEFSGVSYAVFVMSAIAWHTHAHPHLEMKAQPRGRSH